MYSLLESALQSFLQLGEDVSPSTVGKLAKWLKEHFLTSAFQVAEAYQNSYVETLEGIKFALSPNIKTDIRSKRKKEFSMQVRNFYLLNFAEEHKLSTQALEQLKQQVVAQCEVLLHCKENLFHESHNPLNEHELASLLTASKLPNLTQLVIERLTALNIKFSHEQVLSFFRHRELLGRGIERFLRDNKEIEHRLLALQMAGFWDSSDAFKDSVDALQKAGVQPQIQPEDEFKNHDSETIRRVAQAIGLLKRTPFKPEARAQALLMAGTALFSLGSVDEARNLLEEALQLANSDEERALVHFNLFQVYLRYNTPQCNEIAFEHLQITLDLDTAHIFYFYEPRKYKLLKLLGAGGMGCAFLAEDMSFSRLVVLKSFWKTFEHEAQDVFKEALAMKELSREFVPEPYGVEFYGKHAYLLMEYIADAVDGETWLRARGSKLSEYLAVKIARQIVRALQAAHAQGVLHLDLKPANLLFKPSEAGFAVKIIDFGLAKMATPLQQQAKRSQKQSTQFGLRLAGTWDYSPPEQRGDLRFGKPSKKSDVFTFGKTMMRLCSGKEPAFCREKDVPERLRELLWDCIEEDPALRPTLVSVMERLADKQVEAENVRVEPEKSEAPNNKPAENSVKTAKFPIWKLALLGIAGVGGVSVWLQLDKKPIPLPPAQVEAPPPVVIEDKEASYKLGRDFYNQGKWVEAAAAFQKQTEITPNHENAWYNLGNALKAQGRMNDAITAYRKQLKVSPNHKDAWNNLGTTLYAQGKLDEAISAYRQQLSIVPDDDMARNNLDIALNKQGKLAPAVIEDKEASYKLGIGFYNQGKWVEAAAAFQKQTEITPNHDRAWYNLGNTLKAQGKLNNAITAYRKQLEVLPNHKNAWNNLGTTLYAQGKLAEAISAYRQQLSIVPDDDVAWNNLGIALSDQGNTAEAIIAYRKQANVRPHHVSVWHNLGFALFRQGSTDEAIIAYRKQLEITPNHEKDWYNLGNALKAQGKLNDAIAAYRKQLEVLPNHKDAWNNLGTTLHAQGKLDEAISAYRQQLSIVPDDDVAWNNLGIALDKQGKTQEAITAYRKQLEVNPNHEEAQKNLNLLLKKK